MEWIYCNTRKPTEKDGKVIIALDNGEVITGQYSEFSNTWYIGDMCGISDMEVIAWMPFPKYPNK